MFHAVGDTGYIGYTREETLAKYLSPAQTLT
jgi:hypothetical protein